MSESCSVYRLWDASGDLLYIGISKHWPDRMIQHRRDKHWFSQVARIEVEEHRTREEAEDAEANAIRQERPRHNVTHNDSSMPREANLRVALGRILMKPGQHVAFGMTGGRCPVGKVLDIDGTWVTLRLKDWLTGFYIGQERTYRIDDVIEIVYARERPDIIDDDHLATFQTRWLAS